MSTIALSVDKVILGVGGTVTATVTPSGSITDVVTITPGSTAVGSLSPAVLTFSASSTPQTATFTPTVVGTLTLTATDTAGLVTTGSPATIRCGGDGSGIASGSSYPKRSTFVNLTASGDNAVIPPIPGRRIFVLSYALSNNSGSAVSVYFKSSGGSPVSSTKTIAAGGAWARTSDPDGHFATANGEGLSLNLSANANVGVDIKYTVDDH